jgi:hypothetical protein
VTSDFSISYTSPDRRWAEWIAWQLEAEGYLTVIQAWDFSPGQDWAHLMHVATQDAKRTVAVLSPAYLESAHGEAEWRVAYAQDPTGEKGLLVQSGRRLPSAGPTQDAGLHRLRRGLKAALNETLEELSSVDERLRSQEDNRLRTAGARTVEQHAQSVGANGRSDDHVEAQALRTRIEGLNTLEIQQAKYGGMGAPVVLTNQIDDVKREISQCDQTMRETRVRLAELEA